MDLEACPEELEPEFEHQEVPNEEAAVESVRAQDLLEDQQPAMVFWNPQKRQTRSDGYEEMEGPGMQQWDKEPRPKKEISGKQSTFAMTLRAGGCKANSWDFHRLRNMSVRTL
jgi:hypothetical protein